MTRKQALAALGAAYLTLAGGLAWILGGYGLVIAALILAAAVLFGFDHVEDDREAVADPAAQPRHRQPVQPRSVHR